MTCVESICGTCAQLDHSKCKKVTINQAVEDFKVKTITDLKKKMSKFSEINHERTLYIQELKEILSKLNNLTSDIESKVKNEEFLISVSQDIMNNLKEHQTKFSEAKHVTNET